MTSTEETTLRQIYADLEDQLRSIGLRIRSVEGDGNCFFRAVSDQTNGVCDSHGVYRKETAEYMLKNKDDFKDFILAENYESYIDDLSQDGVYVDNDSIQAFARMMNLNVIVHQLSQAPIVIAGTEDEEAPEVHLTYVPQHYNSLRWYDEEADTKSAANIRIADFKERLSKETSRKSPEPDEESPISQADIRQLAKETRTTESRVLRVLQSVKFDREAAERILDQEHTSDISSTNTSFEVSSDLSCTNDTPENSWTVENVKRFAQVTHSSSRRALEVLEKVGYDENKAAAILKADHDTLNHEGERIDQSELPKYSTRSRAAVGKSFTKVGLDQKSSRLGLHLPLNSYRKLPNSESQRFVDTGKSRTSGSRPTVSTSSNQTNLPRDNSTEKTGKEKSPRVPHESTAKSIRKQDSTASEKGTKNAVDLPRISQTSLEAARNISSQRSEEKVVNRTRADQPNGLPEINSPRKAPRSDHQVTPPRGSPGNDAKDSTRRNAK